MLLAWESNKCSKCFSGRRGKTLENGSSVIQQTAHRPAKPIERCEDRLAPLSCSMTLEVQYRLDQRSVDRIEKMKKKSIDQRDDPKEFQAIF